jgi:hypothetical protein
MLKFLKPITIILSLLLISWAVLYSVETGSHPTSNLPASPTTSVDEKVKTQATLPIKKTSQAAPLSTSKLPTNKPATRAPTRPAAVVSTLQPSPKPVQITALSPERWKEWPVMPQPVSETLHLAYQKGLAEGTIDPHAFSILGDCQGEADAFLGVFDTSPGLVETMEGDLQEIVSQFSGSFNRYSPAAKSGSSAGSLLYAPWNDNKEGKCLDGETPLDCELRVHHPSIVFIQLGTHFETPTRNYAYLSTIIEKVLATGAVPVMVTKADNLEGNGFVNQNIVDLAAKYELPLWNFWSSVQTLPSHGLQQDGMHLTNEGNVVHQVSALRVLGAIWQSVR